VVVALTNGVAELIEGGGFNSLDAPVTQDDILQAHGMQARPLMEDDVASMIGGSIFSDIGSFLKKAGTQAYNYLLPRVAPHAQQFVEKAVAKYVPKAAAAGERFLERTFGSGMGRSRKRGAALMRGSGLPVMGGAMDSDDDDGRQPASQKMKGGGFIDDEGSKNPEQHKYEEQFAAASAQPLPSARHRAISERF
jgi:hypothetical protein